MNALEYTCEFVRMDSVSSRSNVPITDMVEGHGLRGVVELFASDTTRAERQTLTEYKSP